MTVASDQEVRIDRGGVVLCGVLSQPAAPRGVVIFVHGSGALDRDANGPGAALNIFNTLAQAAVRAGFAALRYDKRGVGASGGDFATLRQQDLVADVGGWIAFAQGRGLGPVVLLGHSEGTDLVARAAMGAPVSGMVLICPYVTSGRDILIAQAGARDANVTVMPGLRGVWARLVRRVTGGAAVHQARFIDDMQRSSAPRMKVGRRWVDVTWLRDFSLSEPEASHRANRRPTLILSALMDVQCPPGDGAKIAKMNPNATLIEVPEVSHILRHTTVKGVVDYHRQIAEPVDARVGAALENWLLAVDLGAHTDR